MVQQTINIGGAVNDGTGETLREGGDKINDNFTELYAVDAALPETIRDTIAAALVAGTNITITPNDGSDTITIAASGGSSYTDENARDAIGAALVAGAGITITVNDAGDTITIASPSYFIRQDADYTLTSTTAAQKLFNVTANGALTLPTGIYRIEGGFCVASMSATSGNTDFNLLGAGTATLSGQHLQIVGRDGGANGAGAAAGASLILNNNNLAADVVTPATQTTVYARVSGMFKVTTAGTIIPSLALTTAAAAVVKAGTHLRVERVSDLGTDYAGPWS